MFGRREAITASIWGRPCAEPLRFDTRLVRGMPSHHLLNRNLPHLSDRTTYANWTLADHGGLSLGAVSMGG
jgi:hypothetical protein